MKTLTILALFLATSAFADFNNVEVALVHDSSRDFSEINTGVDRGCLGLRAPMGDHFWVMPQTCQGFDRSNGLNTQAVSVCYQRFCLRGERIGGAELETVTGYSVTYDFIDGKLFVLKGGVSYVENIIESESAHCIPGTITGEGDDGRLDCDRGLVSDQLAFQLALGVRFF